MQSNPIDSLIGFFDGMMPLNSDEKSLVVERFKPFVFKRRELIHRAGNRCRYYMFVVHGCLRMYSDDDKGNRHIIKFAPEDTWMTDIDSFFSWCTVASLYRCFRTNNSNEGRA